MRKLMVLLLLVAMFAAASAQDAEPSPFMRAMAMVPTDAVIMAQPVWLTYADYHAGITARGAEVPADWSSFGDLPYLTFLPLNGPFGLLESLREGGAEYPAFLGFGFFDIAQGVQVGSGVDSGQILLGSIEPAAVEAAYTARGYVAEPLDSGVLLCPEAGCDTGTKLDIANTNRSNPFGGSLGRSEIAFAADGILFNAADDSFLRTMAAAHSGSDNFSLLPEVQAVDAALSQYPFVTSVALANPQVLAASDPVGLIGSDATPELIEARIAELGGDPLPAYTMAAFAATADDSGEYGIVMLTFTDSADAAAAALIIDARLASVNSLREDVPYAEYFSRAGTLEPAQVTTDEATGLSIVSVRVVGEPLGLIAGDGSTVFSEAAFGRIFSSYRQRDWLWLVWGGQ